MAKEEGKKFYQNKFGNIFGEQMLTPMGRADYCFLNEPNDHFKPAKYSVNILFKKGETDKADLNKMIAKCGELAKQKYGDKKTGFKYGPIRDGDAENDKGKAPHPGYYYIKATSATKVPTIQSKGGRNVDIEAATILPGNLIICMVQPIMFDDGFSWGLRGVQFVKDDGVKFFHGPDVKDMFSIFSDDEEDSMQKSFPADKEEQKEVATPQKAGKDADLDLL